MIIKLIIKNNKVVTITGPITINSVTISFVLLKDFDCSIETEIDYIVNSNKVLPKHVIENEIAQLLSKYKHGNDIHEHRKK